MQDSALHHLSVIKSRMANACQASGRPPGTVRLLLATKTVPAARIRNVLSAGELLIGENKVQEIRDKFVELQSVPHETHFIGHLQTNKIRDVLKYNVSCIQSVDRPDLAGKLHQRLVFENKKMDVFIQVNTSFEDSKFGVSPDKAIALARDISRFDTLQIKGLMTIGVFSTVENKVRNCYKLLKSIQADIRSENIPGVDVSELSMGMSNDLEIAIEEGATIVRIGTAIFGERIYPDRYYWNESLPVR